MKKNSLFSLRCQIMGRGLLLAIAAFLCASVNAQNLLKNGSFESPIDPAGSSGTTNWALVYAYGGPADFAFANRNTEASRTTDPVYPGGSWGAAFRPNHCSYMHAYHKQIATGLTPGASYTLSGYMHTGYDNNKVHVYIAMFGGADSSIVISNRATETPTQYFMTNTASGGGQIEVRVGLRLQEIPVWGDEDPKFVKSEGWFDVFSLTPTP
jgi:hypothetical protein